MQCRRHLIFVLRRTFCTLCRNPLGFCVLFFFVMGCQTGTRLVQKDLGIEDRLFSKIRQSKKLELRHAIIVDVRPRFQFEMSRLPRSFHAYWKDWSLRGLESRDLENKKTQLQRLLALKGVDPLTRVVILGRGVGGRGEEFFLAATLVRLGIQRISFMDQKQAKAALAARNLPPIENVSYWSEKLGPIFECKDGKKRKGAKGGKAGSRVDIVILSDSERKKVFNKQQTPKKSLKNKLKGKKVFKKKEQRAKTKSKWVLDFQKTLNNKKVLQTRVSEMFSRDSEIKKRFYSKKASIRVSSGDSFWAYGLVLHIRGQGQKACVL